MIISERRLAQLLRDAAEAHHLFEESKGSKDESWPDWYAEYIIARIRKEQLK